MLNFKIQKESFYICCPLKLLGIIKMYIISNIPPPPKKTVHIMGNKDFNAFIQVLFSKLLSMKSDIVYIFEFLSFMF